MTLPNRCFSVPAAHPRGPATAEFLSKRLASHPVPAKVRPRQAREETPALKIPPRIILETVSHQLPSLAFARDWVQCVSENLCLKPSILACFLSNPLQLTLQLKYFSLDGFLCCKPVSPCPHQSLITAVSGVVYPQAFLTS